uniref:ORF1a protein n=1 Tax=Myotis bat alphacoronavirus TaxID=3027593 RepID=A0AAT9T7D8_9ALPC|nr:MAG: ORF1a protein [Myotis bat alphacoronavirus]
MPAMSSNRITLAFANDAEISALGFENPSEAVSFYSEAATSGFSQCRFVSFGLIDNVEGVEDDDYVMVVTGVTQLRAYIDTFGSRPPNIRGWLLFSNCNYFLENLDLIFGRRGGGAIPVDQYMCGSDGKPVLQASEWELTDYFGDEDEIVLSGITYVKAWVTKRAEVSYDRQNVTAILHIDYCYASGYDHTLADGTSMKMAARPKFKKSVVLSEPYNKIYKEIGSPFMDNGNDVHEIFTRPVFLHALVRCKCGTTQWSVGDWKGYKSACCGFICKPISIASASAIPGAVVFTTAQAGTGVKYYNNLFLRHICDVEGLGVWRIIKVQSKDDLVTSGKNIEHECFTDPCFFLNDSKLATDYKIAMLSGEFSSTVKQAIIAGHVGASGSLVDLTEEILGKPWFVRKLDALFSTCWHEFVGFVRSLKLHTSQLLELAKHLACASLSVVDGAFKFVADVPTKLQCCIDKLVIMLDTIFSATCDVVKVGGRCFSKVGDYLLLDNALAVLVKAKIKGPRQAGVNHLSYASVVLGPTHKVKSQRVEFCKPNLVLVDEHVPVITTGYTVVIDGLAFYCADGFYRFMADADTVLQEPVFRSAEDLKPTFDCKPIVGFPEVSATNVAELCVKTDGLLKNYDTSYKKYSTIIRSEKCFITCKLHFTAPMYISDVQRFVDLCEAHYDDSGFHEFYTSAHEAGDIATFISQCCAMDGFDCFKPSMPTCPSILEEIDGGSIWQTFIAGLNSAFEFVKNLKVHFGFEGIVVSVSKRFKKAGAMLAQLYNTFLDTVRSSIKLAGVSFIYYSTTVPKVVLGSVYYSVKEIVASSINIPTESEIQQFRAFDHCRIPVAPRRIEVECVELEEVDFVEPRDFGRLAIIDGYAFYCDGKRYYPSSVDNIAPVCFQKRGGGAVTISDDVQVKSIDPVHKVHLEFEFEDETLMQVCSKIAGTSIKITGGWEQLIDTIDAAMALVGEHIEVPDYYVYDEQGGSDMTLPVMVSQWPIADQGADEDVQLLSAEFEEQCEVDDIAHDNVNDASKSDDQLEVESALSFIEQSSAPIVTQTDLFAFDFASYGGLKVLNQQQNNCWVASTLIQLQLLDLLDDPAMDLFKAGRVSPMVKKCYEAEGAILGSLGDVSSCMEKLLKGRETLTVKCSVTCDCGVSERTYKASVLRMTPTLEPFPYGACTNCNQVLVHTLVAIEGTGVFCREPTVLDVSKLVVKPLCASAYVGAKDGGHYVTNIFDCGMGVDGNGRHPIAHTTLNTICVKCVKWEQQVETPNVSQLPAPFLTFKNVEFYQGDFNDLVQLPHDFVVNAANEKLAHGGGVALVINNFTKGLLQRLSDSHIRTNGALKVGTGVMLNCGNNNIYNVVGPRKGKHAPELLTKAYTSVFAQPGVPLLPLLSVGIFKVPIQESISALLACVGDRVCRCFCYSDDEREAIVAYVSSITQVEPTPIEPLKSSGSTEVSVPECEPFRVEGSIKFYHADPLSLLGLNADRIVTFTDPSLNFCDTLNAFDKHFDGALRVIVNEYLRKNPITPAGNCLTFKCNIGVTVTMVVLPETGSDGYSRNYQRAINKYCKLKGLLLVAVSTASVLRDIVHHPILGYITTPGVVDVVYAKDSVVVNVTKDQRSSYATVVASNKTLGEQLGPCAIEGKSVTETKPVVSNKVVSVLPDVDWDNHYGFKDAGVFHTLDHSSFAFDNNVVSGKRVLKTTDNNCWVNVTCLQLQFANAKFKSNGLQALWESYCVGDVATFCHWLYWITNVNKGEPSDAENALNVISKFLRVQGSIELETSTRFNEGCDDDCCTRRTIATPVVNASLLRMGIEDGVCKHGEVRITRVSSVKGTVIIANPGSPVIATPELYLDGVSYTVFTDNGIGAGHYTVFERATGLAFDGDSQRPADLSTSNVTSMVANVTTNVVFKEPSRKVEFDASKFLDTMNYASEKFFTFGDFLSRNILTLLIYLFSILSLCYKSFKKRDLKVLAGVPQRTGVILRKSIKYNTKALGFFFKIKFYWVKQFFKLCLFLYTIYALSFMVVRFTPLGKPLCDGYVEGYANSTFDKNDYCGNVLCKVCLYGYQELSDFEHTKVVWQHLKDPLIGNIMPFFYLAFLTIFGDFFARVVAFYFYLQYFNAAGAALGYQDSVWLLQAIPFNIFGDEIVVSFIVIRVLLFLKHVLFGCDKPSCVACSKSAKLTRVPVQTIFQGATKSFYVHANGGKRFCKKHNFFCVSCDSFGPGCTFINDVIAPEVGNVVKLNVQSTSPATIEIDKVEFSNGFYYLYSGSTFWKYNFDVTESKYSCKEALKNCNVATDFIVYNNTGSNCTQVKNACVYFSQLLCKPIKLVDSALLASLNVNFSASLHSAFVSVLSNSFSKDLSNCSTMTDCRTALGFDEVSDEDFNAAVSEAHRYDVLLTDISYNNFFTSYAKPEEKLPVHDIATCMRIGAKVANHNVLTKDNLAVVWLVKDFMSLSDESRKYLVRTTKVKGLTFLLTFNDRRMHTTIPTVNIANKKGAGLPTLFSKLYRFFWYFCVCVVILFFSISFYDFSTHVTSVSDYDFKYIEAGVLKDFQKPLSCVHNVFDNFQSWHDAKFGVVPVQSNKCPIVVGVSDEARTIPGVPSSVYLYGKTLVFAMNTIFGASGLCFDERGMAGKDACVFNSACMTLTGLGGSNVYCYKDGLVENSKLYSDLLPHSHYKMADGNSLVLPEIISRGFGFRTIKTLEMTYCRVGQCIDSQEGVCIGLDRFFVYNAGSDSDFVCGSGLFSLLFNLFGIFSKSIPVAVLSGQILFNCCVAFVAVAICFVFTKFKRMFGDMSCGVFMVGFCTIVNNISYIITQNSLGMLAYALIYFLSTRSVRYAWIWHLGFCISYCMLAPWWVLLLYLGSAAVEFMPNLFKLKVSTQLFDGDKFVGTFENAASGTFVLDMHSYEKLANSISNEKLKQYAATYNKYKYYTGAGNEADYRLACFAHLAKAMIDFGTSHQDQLYTPPTVSYNSTLQAGLRKMAQPSGVVERCIVRVSYGNMTLNGVWLGDVVICPRHVIASNTNVLIDYDKELSLVRLHNFSISYGNMFLGVVGVTMRNSVLHIKVTQSNINTPTYTYRTLRPGESFNILACYDGVAAGVYGVNMRTNFTIRGSFINGACGSPGYNVNGNTVEFCYMHQLELGSGCHVGCDFDGAMYGGHEDQPTLQIEGASNLITENVVAFLYGALINGCSWWLSASRTTVERFNEWAVHNGMTMVGNVDTYSILAAKTGVDVQRLLASIQVLHRNFGGNQILGYTSLTDEFTAAEVIKQMFGVNLQSSKFSRAFRNVFIVGTFLTLFWTELVAYTKFFWVNPGYVTPMFFCVAALSSLLMLFLKHKLLFLQMFLLPSVVITAAINLAWDFEVYAYLENQLDYHVSLMGVNAQGLLNIVLCTIVMLIHTFRFAKSSNNWFTYVSAILSAAYNYIYVDDPLNCAITLFASLTGHWFVGAITYKVAVVIVEYFPIIALTFDPAKGVILCYLALGYLVCMFYGILYWVNRFFKLNLGVYDFVVSPAEFKFMVANGLRAPRSTFDSLALSLKLIGVGGERCIKVSSVQSKLTDIKCTNVVLLGCLTSMNVGSNSAEWAYCVELHNKINLCNDPEQAQEMLLALLAFFLSKNSAFGLDDLLESYFSDNTMLQSVASTYVNMPSFIAYETARQSYEDAVANGSPPQLVKQLRHAMNIAKGDFDREAATQRKLDRMAEQAAAQMYKEARAVNRKSKVTSAMHSLLFGMLRRLDMSSIDVVLQLAKDGTVPLSVIPAVSATKLNIVVSDLNSYTRIQREGCVHYAGVIWSVLDVKDNDGKPVHVKEICAQNAESLAWPLFLNCERIVKLQNNEIIPGKLKQRPMKAEGEGFTADGKALYNIEGGRTFMYAFVSDKSDLKVVKWEFEGGCNTIELETPCKFLVESPNGPIVKYLYFVRNLNTLRRGAVLGFIGATVRLQAGKQTEQAVNSSLLTLCAFSVDPAKTYLDAVKSGHKPVSNCVKMLTNGSGNGMAITNGVEASSNQDSYGGASVCLYCRAHIEHPAMDGLCKLKGKYVQVPIGTPDPIRYVLENTVCKVCGCWQSNGCVCDRSSLQTSFDHGYLNEYGALVQLD